MPHAEMFVVSESAFAVDSFDLLSSALGMCALQAGRRWPVVVVSCFFSLASPTSNIATNRNVS